MTDLTPLIHTMDTGPSKWGLHSWTQWLSCGKRAWLRSQQETPDYERLTWSGANVGKVFHALMALHFTRGLQPDPDVRFVNPAIPNMDLVEDRVWQEAKRLFTTYRRLCPEPDFFGSPIGAEFEVMSQGHSLSGEGQYVPADPFSGRYDLLTKMTQDQAQRFLDRFPQTTGYRDLLTASDDGLWIVDYKAYASESKSLVERSMLSHQYVGYQLLYKLTHQRPVNGVIQFTVIKTKKVGFRPIVIPPPTEHQKKSLQALLLRCVEAKARGPVATPSADYCLGDFRFGGMCQFKESGDCFGY